MVPPTAVAEGSAVAIKDPVKDTILTPRFYTTDFEEVTNRPHWPRGLG